MRFRRFRRKSRVAWMQQPGTTVNDGVDTVGGGPAQQWAGFEFFFLAGASHPEPDTVAIPLVIDQPVSETVQGTTLPIWQQFAINQTIQYRYRLRRIVGDIFIAAVNNDIQADSIAVLIEAGIMVRRVKEDGTIAVDTRAQDVGTIGNNTDPWVWRRNWVLGTASASASTNSAIKALNAFPVTNVGYGTKHHIAIDQKTNRIVGPEERLFMNITAWLLPMDGTLLPNPGDKGAMRTGIAIVCPYRVLCSSVSPNMGNRRNASR